MAWVKGQSGNPGGKTPAIAEAARLAREHAPWCIERLRKLASSAKNEVAQIKAMEILLERGLGKAIQPIDTNASVTDLLDAAEQSDLLRAFQVGTGEAQRDSGRDTAGSC